jgi:hypothetical protein
MTKKRKKRISNSALRNIVNTQSTTLVTKDAGGSRCRRGIWGPLVLSFLFPPLRPLSPQHSPVLKHHLFFLPKLLFFTPKINQKKKWSWVWVSSPSLQTPPHLLFLDAILIKDSNKQKNLLREQIVAEQQGLLLCTKSVLLHTFFTNGANPRKSVGSSCSSLFWGGWLHIAKKPN